jgi:hypothetical protein
LLKFAGKVTTGLNDWVGKTNEADGVLYPAGRLAKVGNKKVFNWTAYLVGFKINSA